jgi:hypothetical protein
MVTHSSGRDSFVSMVQSTNLRELVDSAHRLRLVRAADRNIFAQGQMSACLLSVVEVGLQDAPQTGFIQDDHNHDRTLSTLSAIPSATSMPWTK